MPRKHQFLLMKDILEHLGECCEAWQAADGRKERLCAESIERHLEELRRLCRSLQSVASPVRQTRVAA